MALFKPLKGNRAALRSQPLHEGYAYFCVDDGSFHIDYVDENGDLQRKQLNAKDAKTLTGMSVEDIQYSINYNNLIDRPFGDFYEIRRSGNETVTVTGRYTTFTLVSSDILEYEELVSVALYSGPSGSFPSLTRFSNNAYGTYNSILVVTQDGTTCSQVSNNPFPKAGVYLGGEVEYAVLQFKKIPEKYIPSKYETTESVQAKLDEATADLTTYVDDATSSIQAQLDSKATTEYVDSAANQVKNDLLNGAGAAYDTLQELGDLIDDNHDAIDALEIVASGKADKSQLDGKLNVNNPAGTGSLSMNRKGNTEIGLNSTTTGSNNTASGKYADAHGFSTVASSQSAHSEGESTIASGYASHAEGTGTQALGNYAHAEGYKAIADSLAAHAEGFETKATGTSQHVQGQYNIANATYAHIVGNGEDDTNRSNAHTLDWDGNAWFAGDVKVGGTGQGDANAKTLATTEYVDASTSSYVPKSGTTMTGKLVAQNNTNYTTKQVRNIMLVADGQSAPAGGNGDIVLFYA